MENKLTSGHLAALLTIVIWGTTFISTKILLADFQPVEILFFRFVIGLLALLVIYPRRLKGTAPKQEALFALAGLCGICLYYLLENIALTYTLVSNVGVIISIAPFFTAILTFFATKGREKLRANFLIGFAVAMATAKPIRKLARSFSLPFVAKKVRIAVKKGAMEMITPTLETRVYVSAIFSRR